jgi:hypothetical protein
VYEDLNLVHLVVGHHSHCFILQAISSEDVTFATETPVTGAPTMA